ncbi:hypothetical protein CHCC20372_1522 [Bacillus paralicheniformis]|nr:hypothetical protein CHCC5027_2016 [Bacillus paralicheniformis]TWK26478.1 hypothetical protein CHCC20372_1522 [Bacillus paralicheniformis]TWK38434.1 hypothetical protein CHCC20348_3846 [Bacillus paralicheniformis]
MPSRSSFVNLSLCQLRQICFSTKRKEEERSFVSKVMTVMNRKKKTRK